MVNGDRLPGNDFSDREKLFNSEFVGGGFKAGGLVPYFK